MFALSNQMRRLKAHRCPPQTQCCCPKEYRIHLRYLLFQVLKVIGRGNALTAGIGPSQAAI
jgi:hypothetical protein